MARLCTVCTHPERQAIDAALVEHRVGYRRVAVRYGLAPTSVRRHQTTHLSAKLQEAKMLDAEALAARMAQLEGHVDDVLANSKRAHDDRMRLMAVAQGRNNVETLARLAVLRAAELQADQASVQEDARTVVAIPGDAPSIRDRIRIILESGGVEQPDEYRRREVSAPDEDAPAPTSIPV